MKIVKQITYSELTIQDFRNIINEHKGCTMRIDYRTRWADGYGDTSTGSEYLDDDLTKAILAETIPGKVGYTYEDSSLQFIISSITVTLQ